MYRIGGGKKVRWGRLALLLLAACSPASLVDVAPPSTVVDAATVTTASGATQMYNYAVTLFDRIVGADGTTIINPMTSQVVTTSGQLTDELQSVGTTLSGQFAGCIDARDVSVVSCSNQSNVLSYLLYGLLHQPRNAVRQAREALQRYAPNAPQAWQGRMYALEGLTIVYFAELFCSGIPLTTVPLVGAPQPTAGLTTEQLFERALTLFDSALTLGADTTRFVNLAKVGKGRALLGLGRFADAAAAVQGVPTEFVYATVYSASAGSLNSIGNGTKKLVQVVDREGGNGLVWSTDPRTATTTNPAVSGAMQITAKYSVTTAGVLDVTVAASNTPIRVADGLEARLIEAEADLAAGGSNWLTILNTLRSTCVGGAVCAPVPPSANMPFSLTATSLPPLTDPGTADPNARLNLLLKERAMWLYITGHREGDLRRLAHVYHRDPATLWPTGIYNNAGFTPLIAASELNGTAYGTDVVLYPGLNEAKTNPLYIGCFNTDP